MVKDCNIYEIFPILSLCDLTGILKVYVIFHHAEAGNTVSVLDPPTKMLLMLQLKL